MEGCPYLKYPHKHVCEPCHEACHLEAGCSGSSPLLGKGGCNSCHVVEAASAAVTGGGVEDKGGG